MKTRLPQENIPWQPVLSYKKMQPVNFYSWKKGCISKFKQKRGKIMFEMKPEYYIGIKMIDEQHKQLFTYADEAYSRL